MYPEMYIASYKQYEPWNELKWTHAYYAYNIKICERTQKFIEVHKLSGPYIELNIICKQR